MFLYPGSEGEGVYYFILMWLSVRSKFLSRFTHLADAWILTYFFLVCHILYLSNVNIQLNGDFVYLSLNFREKKLLKISHQLFIANGWKFSTLCLGMSLLNKLIKLNTVKLVFFSNSTIIREYNLKTGVVTLCYK